MNIHEKARVGFTKEVEAYDRGRPDYPPQVIEYLVRALELRPGRTVLDLGAGTGKLTKLLIPTGARVIAVEPLAAMRAKLPPEVEQYEGTAEAIPLDDVSVDAVCVAQAFHWFDGPRALSEIRRICKGKLALIWNVRDHRVEWVRELTKLLEPYEAGTPRYASMKWREVFGSTPLEHTRFEHRHPADHQTIIDRVTSISFIAALGPADRSTFLGELERLLKKSKNEALELPYETHVYVAPVS